MVPHVLTMEIRELLGKYYKALSGKGNCCLMLADDFSLKLPVAKEALGKQGYEDSLFFKYAKSLEVKEIIVDGERACALINYHLASPNGDRLSCDAAEIWEMKGGKLASLEMYFDTAEYQRFMLPILFPLTRLKKKPMRP